MADLRAELEVTETERRQVHDAITDLYWTFTRARTGKPPAVVRPDLYKRRRELDARIRELRALLRTAEAA